MNEFFGSLRTFPADRETIIKTSLVNHLSDNAKEIQFEYKERDAEGLGVTDGTNSLCATIEAIFLHGLKDSFLKRTITVIAGESERRPEPSFWPPLLIVSHKQTIECIQSLSQVTTEIGCCRSWIRLHLNDGLLSSNFTTLRKNSSSLSSYYKRHALLRDGDTLEMVEKIVEGIETCVTFDLPCNSSLLNQWTDQPLQMAGLYVPPLRSCPIASGVDIASSMREPIIIETPKPVQTNELFSKSIANSPFNYNPIRTRNTDLDDAVSFNLLLDKFEADIPEQSVNTEDDSLVKLQQAMGSNSMGNSIVSKMGWSSTETDDDVERTIATKAAISRSNSMTQSISSLKSRLDRHSYHSLLARHSDKRMYNGTMDLEDIWNRFETSLAVSDAEANGSEDALIDPEDEDLDFEVVQREVSEKFSIDQLHGMVEQSCKISQEKGLDSQNFTCQSCQTPLGVGFTTAVVCSFSGCYYCSNCISPEAFLIPARVIYNWDFRSYPVSKRAASFLTEFQYQPFIDFELLNPDIYMAVGDMAVMQSLRIQLNFIRAYLFTCSESIIDKMKKSVLAKDYLYEHIHRYSIADLSQIQKGQLSTLLQNCVAFGAEHILDCRLCSQKGFICEICNSSKVLYPFHIKTTYRCDRCGAIFHDKCLNADGPCPKCERKRKREDLPLLDAINPHE